MHEHMHMQLHTHIHTHTHTHTHTRSVSQCVHRLSGQSGLPVAKPAVEEEDTEKPSMSLSVSHLTFVLSTELRKASAKHLASLTLTNMEAQVK